MVMITPRIARLAIFHMRSFDFDRPGCIKSFHFPSQIQRRNGIRSIAL